MKLTTFLYHEINNTPSEFHKINNLSVTEDIFYDQLRFIKNVQNIKKIKKGQLTKLNIEIPKKKLKKNKRLGIF